MATPKTSISKSAKSSAGSRVVMRKRGGETVHSEDTKSPGGPAKGTRAAMQAFIARLRNLSPEEFDASLRAAGIITKSGELAKPYKS